MFLQLAAGGSGDVTAVVAALGAATPDSVRKAAAALFSKPVSVAAVGNTIHVPNYTSLAKLFA